MPAFYEFFAGGGMARAGLGDRWTCLFANEIDQKKAACYAANWGSEQLCVGDVAVLTAGDIPGQADLAWASFPCQDLSLAGNRAGLAGERSGTFWPFWRLMKSLAAERRVPTIVVLENVCGALTSHEGKDFIAIGSALAQGGYRFGALVIDAVNFVPQSRKRLFIVGVRDERASPAFLTSEPSLDWHPEMLLTAYERLSGNAKEAWVWWRLPSPPQRVLSLADILEDIPEGACWHTADQTKRLLRLMSVKNQEKVERARLAGRPIVGAVYRRTRKDGGGRSVQRTEVRFDLAGCLRTPAGGSSRQTILIVHGDDIRSRLLSPREAARLMGLPDSYKLPANYNEAYHIAGDGVAAPVVRFLAENLLEPLVGCAETSAVVAAAERGIGARR